MGESTKAVFTLLLIVGVIAGSLAWMMEGPDAAIWGFRIVGPTVAIVALGLILRLHFRDDVEHDYLRDITGTYFNRDGFCFALVPAVVNGVAFMDAYFQSQYDNASIGRIAMRPARGFFLSRAKIGAIIYDINCPPAGFGFARIAIGVPQELQGERQSFEVGAAVEYPEEKGDRVRFHDGIFVRTKANFGNPFGKSIMIAGAAAGSIVLTKPATVVIELPVGVAEDVPENIAPEIEVLWQLGEPPLGDIA